MLSLINICNIFIFIDKNKTTSHEIKKCKFLIKKIKNKKLNF